MNTDTISEKEKEGDNNSEASSIKVENVSEGKNVKKNKFKRNEADRKSNLSKIEGVIFEDEYEYVEDDHDLRGPKYNNLLFQLVTRIIIMGYIYLKKTKALMRSLVIFLKPSKN